MCWHYTMSRNRVANMSFAVFWLVVGGCYCAGAFSIKLRISKIWEASETCLTTRPTPTFHCSVAPLSNTMTATEIQPYVFSPFPHNLPLLVFFSYFRCQWFLFSLENFGHFCSSGKSPVFLSSPYWCSPTHLNPWLISTPSNIIYFILFIYFWFIHLFVYHFVWGLETAAMAIISCGDFRNFCSLPSFSCMDWIPCVMTTPLFYFSLATVDPA